jgi:hypothetical protein
MTHKPKAKSPHHAVSDEAAAAYIADALMELALQFEATHFAQIRRYYQSITPTAGAGPRSANITIETAASARLRTSDSRSSSPADGHSSVPHAARERALLSLCEVRGNPRDLRGTGLHVRIRGAHRSRNGVVTAATLTPPSKRRLAATREEGVLATAKLAGGYAVAQRQSGKAELQARRPVHHVRVEAITGAPIQGRPQPAAGCAWRPAHALRHLKDVRDLGHLDGAPPSK